jgi:predicted transcriptional regulator
MDKPHTIELESLLNPETFERLQTEAERQNTTLNMLVREAIEEYLDQEAEFEDTPNEKILADLREALLDVKAGNVRPAHEVLEEMRHELAQDDDED